MSIAGTKLVTVELPVSTWLTVLTAIADEAQSVTALMQQGGSKIPLPTLLELHGAVAKLNEAAEAIGAAATGS